MPRVERKIAQADYSLLSSCIILSICLHLAIKPEVRPAGRANTGVDETA
jgi:hypothetical protein